MTKKDQQLLAEAYQQVDEGILRRAASQVAGAARKLKGIPGTVKGAAKELGGKALSGMGAHKAGGELQQVGQADKAAAKEKGSGGKAEHFKTSLVAEIKKDVESLGVVEDVEGFMAAITNVLNTHIPSGEQSFVSKTVGAQSPITVNDPPATKPPATKPPATTPGDFGEFRQAAPKPTNFASAKPAKKKRPAPAKEAARELSTDPRNVRRREKTAAKAATKQKRSDASKRGHATRKTNKEAAAA